MLNTLWPSTVATIETTTPPDPGIPMMSSRPTLTATIVLDDQEGCR
jgi:hypothetical protein